MSTTLKLTHKAIGAEVRRDTFDVVVDGELVGSLEMPDTVELPVEPGRHTLQVQCGRNSSRTESFDATGAKLSLSDAPARGFYRCSSRPSSFTAWPSYSYASRRRLHAEPEPRSERDPAWA